MVTVFAPAGYGKSTLLGEMAESDPRPFAWVSLEHGDNDPVVLMTHIAEALDRITTVGPKVFDALRRAGTALWSTAVPRLGAVFASIERPAVLALDDLHALSEPDSLDVVAAIAGYVPLGSQLILVGRQQPNLHLARARAERRLVEFGQEDLAFDAIEADALLRAAGVELTEPDVAELTRQTEGWAAGLYLAALSLREGRAFDRGAESARVGPDNHIADYLRLEVLSRMAPGQVQFLRRTAVLGHMCGPLCDAVLGQAGSASMLEALQRSNRFLVPLDSRGEWYRYHHLFRELLLRELELREPAAIPTLNRRAAQWCEENGMPEDAIEYAFAGEDVERAARVVLGCWRPTLESGRLDTARKWIERIEEAGLLERYPAIAIQGAWTQGMAGHAVEAERLVAVAERSPNRTPPPDGSPTIEPWVALLRASMCRRGVEQMRADARRTLELTPKWSYVRALASLALAISFVLDGDADRADEALTDTVVLAKDLDVPAQLSHALAQRSLLSAARGDFDTAERLAHDAQQALAATGLAEYQSTALNYVALGRVALHRKDLELAREQFARGDRLRPLLTHFRPYLSVQVRLELVRWRIALGDPAGALIIQREIEQLLRLVPALGVLVEQAGELRQQINAMSALSGGWMPLLTEAELRVLPLLATHLTLTEIAQRQYVSHGTIKTQTISIYRKLEVAKRREAIERAVELGMIDSAAVPRSRDFKRSG